jgi:hypothetical protein
MSVPIKISELALLNTITNDDYIIINDSASVLTYRATFDTLSNWITGSNCNSASYADTTRSASYSDTASWAQSAEWSRYALSSSYASRSLYTTYVYPVQPLPAKTVNMIGTASWAESASMLAYTPEDQDYWYILAEQALTASYLNYTGVFNGTASYALHALSASYAPDVLFSTNGDNNWLTKWQASQPGLPLVNSRV